MVRTRSRRTRPQGNRFRPVMERLEDRRLLSCTITQTGSTVVIQGDKHNNLIAIKDTGTGDAHNITVKCGNGSLFTSGTVPVTEVMVHMGRGADRIEYNLAGDASAAMTLDATGGVGRDAINAHLNGHQLLSGADYTFNFHGGVGADDLTVFADDNVHIASGASLTVNAQGGRGRDHLAARYKGKLEGMLSIDLDSGRGAGSANADITLQAGSTGTVHSSTQSAGRGSLLGTA